MEESETLGTNFIARWKGPEMFRFLQWRCLEVQMSDEF